MSNKVEISFTELIKLINLINDNHDKIEGDFIITIENSSSSGIGIATNAKLSNWINTPIIAEADITDYRNW